MARVQTGLNRVDEAIAPTDTPVERTLLSQYQKRYQITRRTLPLSMKTLSPGRLKNRLLTKLPYLLRNVQLFVTSSLNHSCCKEGRLIVPLPKDPNAKPIGESRSQAVKRFLSLEPKGFSS